LEPPMFPRRSSKNSRDLGPRVRRDILRKLKVFSPRLPLGETTTRLGEHSFATNKKTGIGQNLTNGRIAEKLMQARGTERLVSILWY